ncbi:hypothetical protein HNQ34_003140 [Anoxybacillus tepidamans]|uniref:REase associating with pPIWI RE domain-containing protein n=1 Tax=Anoxybacteroides tepidamans TaxID=265948 RepID=A0A7W8MVW6_9BACL|nr:hypothetical protein [Anoxybacillus tepidamans]MBB5326022.1 hypothetical protein [Anoxybacillus tepidamans]
MHPLEEESYQQQVLKTVALLARGIQDFDRQYKEGTLEELPSAWKKASARLHLIGLKYGVAPGDLFPLTLDRQMKWLGTPLTTWPYPRFTELFSLEEDFTEPVLYDISVTDFCIMVAQEGVNPVLEQDTAEFIEMKRKMSEEEYRHLRTFLIQHPVVRVADTKILKKVKQFPSCSFQQLCNLFYERIPLTSVVPICPRCGWTLHQDVYGRYQCDTDKCQKLTRNWEGNIRFLEDSNSLLRVKRGIRRYIVDPGVSEIDLYNQLDKMRRNGGPFALELYPDKDEYDIAIKFQQGENWAIDVKDWATPHQLAFHVKPFSETTKYDRAFLIVPSYRGTKYVEKLKVLCRQEYTIMTDKDFVRYIKRIMEQEVSESASRI